MQFMLNLSKYLSEAKLRLRLSEAKNRVRSARYISELKAQHPKRERFIPVYRPDEYGSLLQEGDDVGATTYRGARSSESYCAHGIRCRKHPYSSRGLSWHCFSKNTGYFTSTGKRSAKGRSEGEAKGRTEAFIAIADKMLAKGMPPETVAEMTGLTVEEPKNRRH